MYLQARPKPARARYYLQVIVSTRARRYEVITPYPEVHDTLGNADKLKRSNGMTSRLQSTLDRHQLVSCLSSPTQPEADVRVCIVNTRSLLVHC
jgi:hypothetical protein